MKRIIVYFEDDLNAKIVFAGISAGVHEDGTFNTHSIDLFTYKNNGVEGKMIVDKRANKNSYTVYVSKYNFPLFTETEVETK